MKKIGLFGGTFDPVHTGHTAIAHAFLSSGFIDELWVLLTPDPPHKSGRKFTAYEIRKRMLKTALTEPGIRILTVEEELPRPSYSSNTLRYLKSKYPEYEFYFCIGEDSLKQFTLWKDFRYILQEAKLLAARRPGFELSTADKEVLARTEFVEHTPVDISSTRIREVLAGGGEAEAWLPPGVSEIIKEQNLY